MTYRNRTVIVAKRASGIPGPDNFRIVETARPRPTPSGVVIRMLYASIDPAMRGWLSAEKNYLTVPDGSVMRAHGVGEIVDSDNPKWHVGDVVYGFFGWQEFFSASPDQIMWKIDLKLAPAPAWLGCLGLNGLTAWLGYRHFGRPRAGETVLVSTAAGGVGSVVGQLAKADNLRAVGLTSGSEKIALAVEEFGYVAAIDYKIARDLKAEISQACPKGVDIYYDNVAGEISDAAFPNLNVKARVVQCGTASIQTWIPGPVGPRRERDILVKRLSWNGFVVLDHADLFPQALAELTELYSLGRLKSREEVLKGLDAAPGAIELLYAGRHLGRLCVSV